MSPRAGARTAPCTKADAGNRLAQARKFLEAAELVQTEVDSSAPSASVAASLAVLAGIAASDAACCAALGQRSRAQDHRSAAELVASVVPDGPAAARQLLRLLDLKDSAQYGLIPVSRTDLAAVMRNAQHLVDFAATVASRR